MTGLASCPPNSRVSVSATVRELCPFGITEASTGVQTARSAGRATTSMSAPVTTATRSGRRMTACASRYHAPCSAGRSGRRRRTASFAPQIANIVGAITSEATPATSATTAPAIPIDCRKPSGNTASVMSANDTVAAL